MPVPYWVGHYIGLPFKERGRTTSGLDCWGLVRMVLQDQFGLKVTSYAASYRTTQDNDVIGKLVRNESANNWDNIRPGFEQVGDVIVMRVRGAPMHVGMVVGDNQMLHIERNINSVIEPYNGVRWKNRVLGFFRYKQD